MTWPGRNSWARFEQVPSYLALVVFGVGQGEGDGQAGRRAHEVQAQPPEEARVAGAVAIGGPAGQVAAQGRRARASALDRRRVHDPGVVVPVLGVGAKQADARPRAGPRLAQPLVVAGLVRDVGEPGAQMRLGVAQEPRLRGEAQERLEHGQRQQLGVGDLGGEPDPRAPLAQLRTHPTARRRSSRTVR